MTDAPRPPSEPLSGRELEIATAKALGWTELYCYPRGNRELIFERHDMEGVGSHTSAHFLSQPEMFAEVLAALDAVGTSWKIEMSADGESQIAWASIAGWIDCHGATYREAMCRAFVAWKQS